MRRSTRSLMTCSQRQASACTSSQSRPMTSTSRHSASRCLRMTRVAIARPASLSSRWRSPSTESRPSRSMRATVCETVGPDCPSRSAMRARSGTMPSSSSSKMVRRYISVVSMRSLTAGWVLCWWCPGRSTRRPSCPTARRVAAFPHLTRSRPGHVPTCARGRGAPSLGSVPSVLWFRRDLRRHDNPALLAAARGGARRRRRPRSCRCSCSTRALWDPAGAVRRACLVALAARARRVARRRLVVRHGDPLDVVPEVAAAAGARTVHVAADFAPYGATARRRGRGGARRDGRALVAHRVAVRRGARARAQGRRHAVPRLHAVLPRVARARLARARARPRRVADVADRRAGPLASDGDPRRARPRRDGAARRRARRPRSSGGRPSAPTGLASYADLRDRADLAGTSGLSTHLQVGRDPPAHAARRPRRLRGARGVPQGDRAGGSSTPTSSAPAPESARTSLDPRFAPHAARLGAAGRRAVRRRGREGRTGYPFVDAGMRQLLAEGWVHNRVRMVVASFLVKDLHLPWQRGARWFMR